jgi:branched-chain amino acid transport system permease protein
MRRSRRTIARGLAIVALLVAPWMLYPIFLMKLLCMVLFASAFNLLLGYTGLLSFGHAAFFATGAYAAGHAIKAWGLTPELALLFGIAAAGAVGYIVGGLAIRRQGIYFAMVTLALAQMVYFYFLQAHFTGGDDGLQGIPRGRLFGLIPLDNDLVIYHVVVVIVLFGLWLLNRTIHSPFGQILKSIRENERRTISLGYDVDRFKLVAFVLSAALAGLAGATKAVVLGFASLTDAHWQMSGEVILMTLLGGLGKVAGPIVGAAVIVTLQNELADKVGSMVTVIMGLIFIVCVLTFRRGIVGEISEWQQRREARNLRVHEGASIATVAQ